MVHSSTNFVMNGQYFAINGVSNFISNALKMDPQDLVTKFEGYALQGLVGVCFDSIVPNKYQLFFFLKVLWNSTVIIRLN